MQVNCPNCSTLLQLNSGKLPPGVFSIKCPQCEYLFTAQSTQNPKEEVPPPMAEETAFPARSSAPEPVSQSPGPVVRPVMTEAIKEASPSINAATDVLQALLSLLGSQGGSKPVLGDVARRRRLVACLANQEMVDTVRTAVENHSFNFLAVETVEEVTQMFNTGQAVDILLLDPGFQPGQQGSASIMRFINSLNPQRRRRLYLAVISQSYQTLDAQAAFVHGVNVIINSRDLDKLPGILDEGIKSFNDLYRVFNAASGLNNF